MASGKKKIIVYSDWIIQFNDLTDEEAGRLIKHFFMYVNDMNPQSDRLTELLFNPIKATLKRDLLEWERKQGINRENGSKGGRPKKPEITQNNPVGFSETQNNPEKGVSVSVNDNKLPPKPPKGDSAQIDWVRMLSFFNETFDKKSRVINDSVKKKYLLRLKEGYTKDNIQTAMINARKSQHHRESNFIHCTLEFFSRADKLDYWINAKPKQEQSSLMPKMNFKHD